MLDIREIEYWISRYEQEADKLDHCVTLAALYACRNELVSSKAPQALPEAYPAMAKMLEEPAGRYGDSEFLRMVEGVEPSAAWKVMDELMETIEVVNRRAYESVMRKLSKLHTNL